MVDRLYRLRIANITFVVRTCLYKSRHFRVMFAFFCINYLKKNNTMIFCFDPLWLGEMTIRERRDRDE